jgi:N-methylhydantoinase A/acetophenone carboxylase
MPGPACYDQGGKKPTVTDADLVLGYLNPDNYLGGKMLLDLELSQQAIKNYIADPLGIDIIEAAMQIKQIVDARMGQEVFNEVALKGHDPRDFVLFACGGAGAAHACGFAPYLQVNKVLVSTFSPIFGAFGASTVNCQQVWEKSKAIKVFQWDTKSYCKDTNGFNEVINTLKDQAIRDLKLEGFEKDQIQFRLELDMRFGMQYNLTRIISPHLNVTTDQDFKDICDQFTEQYSQIYTPEATFPMGGINVECFFLTAFVETAKSTMKQFELKEQQPRESARLPMRQAVWDAKSGFQDTPVFAYPELEAGNMIEGPALIEARETTYVIEPGWKFTLDCFHNAILEQV